MTTTMKCHYEILGVERNATADDLKKSYRKLALQWHPDKNPDRVEEVTKHFLLIQQAYDVLIDPQERAWYDKHREAILRGGHGRGDQYTDDSLDTFQYFNSSCYSGYNDSDKGFYTVYRKVFEQLAEEDYVFMEDKDDCEMPGFGDSLSSYEDVVGPFYAYWESFYTSKSYVWVEKYDTREAPDRRVRRLMEAENKKLRDAARKERSEEVRALVGFVRKRDKRVQAYRKKLEERAAEVTRKTAARKDQHLKERQKMFENYEEVGWSAMSGLEDEMQKLEANLQEQFGDKLYMSGSDAEVDEDDDEILDDLFCVACNKSFKSDRAFANHEKSKKHKENVSILKTEMVEDEDGVIEELPKGDDSVSIISETLSEGKQKLSKKQKKRRKQRAQQLDEVSDEKDIENTETNNDSEGKDFPIEPSCTTNDTTPLSTSNNTESDTLVTNGESGETIENVTSVADNEGEVIESSPVSAESQPTESSEVNGKISNLKEEKPDQPKVSLFCNVCHKEFSSRNKLFQHVKSEGHAVHIQPDSKSTTDSKSKTKKKGRKKGKN